MNAVQDAPVCVLTGDIVKSSALSRADQEAVMNAVAASAQMIATWPDAGRVRHERFRGDGWQMCLPAPRWALRACLLVRAAIRSACAEGETRIAAAIGSARLAETLAASSGPAFEASGRGLETLKTHRYWAIGGALGNSGEAALADGLFTVCDELSQGWTARQADVFARLAAVAPPSMAELAEALDVQPQTVQTHFARAGGHALLDAALAFETARA